MMKRSFALAGLLLASTSLGFAQTQPSTETQSDASSGQAECLAGDTNCKPGAKPMVEGQANTQTDMGTTGSTDGKANFGMVMSSIKAGKTNVSAISGLTAVNEVNVIRVADLAEGNNMQALDKAITDSQEDITGLQTAIDSNTALKAKLDAESVQASSVVAANVEADGSVTLYVR